MRLRSLAAMLCVLCFFGFAISSTQAQEQRRLALVIGNSAYPSGPLRNPVNDAEAVAAKLKDLGFEVITVVN